MSAIRAGRWISWWAAQAGSHEKGSDLVAVVVGASRAGANAAENEERVPAVLLYPGWVPMPGCSRVSRLRTKATTPILGVRRFLNASEEAAGDTARSLPPFAG